jgi:hypothetical protein
MVGSLQETAQTNCNFRNTDTQQLIGLPAILYYTVYDTRKYFFSLSQKQLATHIGKTHGRLPLENPDLIPHEYHISC